MLITVCHWFSFVTLDILYNGLKYNSEKGSPVFISLTKGPMAAKKGEPCFRSTTCTHTRQVVRGHSHSLRPVCVIPSSSWVGGGAHSHRGLATVSERWGWVLPGSTGGRQTHTPAVRAVLPPGGSVSSSLRWSWDTDFLLSFPILSAFKDDSENQIR